MKRRVFMDFIPAKRPPRPAKQSARPISIDDEEFFANPYEDETVIDTDYMMETAEILDDFVDFEDSSPVLTKKAKLVNRSMKNDSLDDNYEEITIRTPESKQPLPRPSAEDFVSEPQSFAATILKVSNIEKIKQKLPIFGKKAKNTANDEKNLYEDDNDEFIENALNPPEKVQKSTYLTKTNPVDACQMPAKNLDVSIQGFVKNPQNGAKFASGRNTNSNLVANLAKKPGVRPAQVSAVAGQMVGRTAGGITGQIVGQQTARRVAKEFVPPELKTHEELLALARRQAEAMQHTREARMMQARREAEMLAERAAEIERQREIAEAKRQEEARMAMLRKYPPKPHFINTNTIKKRPLSEGPVYHSQKTRLEQSLVSGSIGNNRPTQFISNRPNETELTSKKKPLNNRFLAAKNGSTQRQEKPERNATLDTSVRPSTVIVPSVARKTPNFITLIIIAMVAGSIFGAVVYFMLLAK